LINANCLAVKAHGCREWVVLASVAGCAAVWHMMIAIGASMVMIIFDDEDDGHDDKVDHADCDMLTETDDGDNTDHNFEEEDDDDDDDDDDDGWWWW
jgi:hypothetical protein